MKKRHRCGEAPRTYCRYDYSLHGERSAWKGGPSALLVVLTTNPTFGKSGDGQQSPKEEAGPRSTSV